MALQHPRLPLADSAARVGDRRFLLPLPKRLESVVVSLPLRRHPRLPTMADGGNRVLGIGAVVRGLRCFGRAGSFHSRLLGSSFYFGPICDIAQCGVDDFRTAGLAFEIVPGSEQEVILWKCC